LLAFSGLQSKIVQAELRMEAGAPVPGLVIRAAMFVSAEAAAVGKNLQRWRGLD
jgi:hypothetical protein